MLFILYHQIITVYECLLIWMRCRKFMHRYLQSNMNTTSQILGNRLLATLSLYPLGTLRPI
jgi:hypothetical protein